MSSPRGLNRPARAARRSRRTPAGRPAGDPAGRARPARDTTGPGGSGSHPQRDLVDRGLAADPARRGRDEMPLGDLRIVERARQPDHDRVVGLAERRGIAAGRAEHLLAVEQALGPQEPDRQLGLVAGRPHRDRDRDRVLARTGRPDLERRLADDPVVADLERFARGRPRSGGSSRAGRAGSGPRSGPARRRLQDLAERHRARRTRRWAASSASPSAASPDSPPPVSAHLTNMSAAVEYASSIALADAWAAA